MKHLYNSEDLKERRRSLRRLQTDAERKLWQVLRGKQMEGARFVRQYSVGSYILDFYCPALRLAIEVDGSQHIDNDYDTKRTKYLKEKDITVIRFWNNDVLQNLNGVYEKIRSTVETLRM
ncbi:DNA-cytosine methyltransferase [Candidatus Jorgensenbacteria bacterium CG23_combo_of_CG06-09_8_20_14_all_54_14]|uniref:DNA-cytosine methyltransferase n=1 Tax=Candidatus Jorgensenbacteria bacterium CG23_combo_of_CG06-09_8_20_14_all_54_14 TaxID=1974595 RepID=A0A2G9ZAA8_9BACT|nr:MAG: DNA-cytosine methyltransferase [Candidatus Jorgensenbacteria bacterium CG23_combo_of_CG06-09_8_20_14_all_54_14]